MTTEEPTLERLKAQRRSRLLLRAYQTWWRLRRATAERSYWLRGAAALLALAAATLTAMLWRHAAERHFSDATLLQSLSAWLIGLGGALIGASTIGASMILFAMQVNVERMPHGLFRRLSRDAQLMGAFGGSFLLATSIAGSGLAASPQWASAALAYAAMGSVGVLALLLFAYGRALDLVNPIKQLAIVIRDARRQLAQAGSWAERLKPLVDDSAFASLREKGVDTPRLAFLTANPTWDTAARRGVAYAISYARRFGEIGDAEVVGAALVAVVSINRDYLAAKQMTFVASNPLVEIPLSGDSFITETLEHLRRLSEAAINRSDESQTIGVFRTLANLSTLYCTIDYGKDAHSKSHAVLAGAYLRSAVKRASGRMGPDVLMDGARQLGGVAVQLVQLGRPADAVSLIDDLGALSMLWSVKSELRPATQQAVQQLADVTIAILRTGRHDIAFPAKRLINAVAGSALQALALGDSTLGSDVGFAYEPYYSTRSFSSLHSRLAPLVNATLARGEGDEEAQHFVRCMTRWASELFDPQKQLLIQAVKQRSGFAYDVLTWNLGVAELLIALSSARATGDHDRKDLRKAALYLARTPGWLPTDKETVHFLEAFSGTEELFTIAIAAQRWGADELFPPLLQQLLSWSLDAGAQLTGWGILEKGLMACAALLLMKNEPAHETEFLTRLTSELAKSSAPNAELRSMAAASLLRTADEAAGEFEISRVKVALNAAPRDERQRLLRRIAAVLDPEATDGGPYIAGDS